VQLDKDTIVNFLRERGDNDQADKAAQELPDQVDHEQHAGLLSKFGVEPKELLGKIGGLKDML
jgi:hypothetical protein